mmetsp:Transcript_30432/g.55220  ORF Transcript_30432/g.55220 Transcript_30432/m.55220 type:complete len:1351 (+) Transcript_30432:96-4148(+)|eukprot:CAMPEP_0201918964 /NCGR_PEP_ID=MMETSP0903-20130614/7989_1 /ASSEMBLY_ACC=CAM_ASM_000552 /TAXON_ID=420261 /ORGANISM="Thalassiosira antarctica, Strain CCMP982" /LENGTH=1350 /DNA_ID=CAMNT_0048455389 /DNA_START=52 /DNA_END=4104 /DNA_ORIENTATION=+
MAGFSSRLREKIESSRSNTATGNAPSNYQPKNIRGLTRLGVSGVGAAPSPSGGLLSGRNSSAGGAHGTGVGVTAGNSVPLPIQTSSLRKENKGQDASISVVHRPPLRRGPVAGSSIGTPTAAVGLDSSTAPLGGSKIVPGWGAGSSDDTNNAPSGHLGGIKSRDHLARREITQRSGDEPVPHTRQAPSSEKHVPWALHQPSSPPATLSQLSLSRRRWGDEEDDDSDEDFPQIGAKPPATTATKGVNSYRQYQGYRVGGGQYDSGEGRHALSNNCIGWKEKNGNGYSKNTHRGNDWRRQAGRKCDDDRVENQVNSSSNNHNVRDWEEYGSLRQLGTYYHDRGYRASDNSHGHFNRDRGSNVHSVHFDRGSYCDENHGDRWGKSQRGLYDRKYYNDDTNDSRWGPVQNTHSHVTGHRESGVSISNSRGLDDFDGNRNNSTRPVRHSRGGSDGVDRIGDWHGHGRTGDNHCIFSQAGAPDVAKQREAGKNDIASLGDMLTRSKPKPLLDPDSARYHGLPEARLSRAVLSPEHVNRSLLQRHLVSDDSTPMVLLRSSDMAQTSGEESLVGSAEASNMADRSTEVTQLGKLERHVVLIDASQPPQAWASKSVASVSLKSTLRPPITAEERSEHTADSSVAGKQLFHLSTCKIQSVQLILPAESQDEIEQDRKDRAMEQQQNVLRQVAERRAAAATTMKGESLPEKCHDTELESARTLSNNVEDEKEAEFLVRGFNQCRKEGCDLDWKERKDKPKQKAYLKPGERNTESRNPCRKEGHTHDWSECPNNYKSDAYSQKNSMTKAKQKAERRNPCRIEGHGHDWNDCPNNPKSESFIRNNPCRIEGHEHDWNDCLDNPKSDNYVRPNNRKGRRGSKSLSSCVAGNRKHGSTSTFPATGEELSANNKGSVTGGIATESRTRDDCSLEDDRREENATSELLEEPSELIDESDKSMRMKPFVPAPPPAISAWMSGPPPAITQICAPSTIRIALETLSPESPSDKLPQLKEQATGACIVLSQVTHNVHQNKSSFSATPKNVRKPILPPPGALFPGNYALFGESLGSTAVYDSWNPPPLVMSSTYVDPWKPNPFAPTTVTAPSSGVQFGSIWSDCAISLVTSRKNNDVRAGGGAFRTVQSIFIEPIQSEAMESSVSATFSFDSLITNDNNSEAEKKGEEKYSVGKNRRTENGDSVVMDTNANNDKEVTVIPSPEDHCAIRERPSNHGSSAACKGKQKGELVPTMTKTTPKSVDIKPVTGPLLDQKPNNKKEHARGKKMGASQSRTTSAFTNRRHPSSRGHDKKKCTRPPKKLGFLARGNCGERGSTAGPGKHVNGKTTGSTPRVLNNHKIASVQLTTASEETS